MNKESAIRVKVITDEEEFESLQPAWNALLANSPRQDAFMTWEWQFAWWRHFGERYKMQIITIWQNEELVGIAPLMIMERRKYGFTFHALCNFNSPYVDVGGFVFRTGDSETLFLIFSEIMKLRRYWDSFEFHGFPIQSAEVVTFSEFFRKADFISYNRIDKYYVIPIEETWDEYLKKISSNLRTDVRRRVKRIREAGEVRFEQLSGEQVRWEHFESIFQINKYGKFPGLYQSPQEQAFQRELFERMQSRIWINFLYLNSAPIAFRYGFLYNGRAEDWRNGYDIRQSQYAPGKVLLYFTLEDVFNRCLKEFDFLLGEETYKARWCADVHKYVNIRFVWRHNVLAILGLVLWPQLKLAFRNLFKQGESKNAFLRLFRVSGSSPANCANTLSGHKFSRKLANKGQNVFMKCDF